MKIRVLLSALSLIAMTTAAWGQNVPAPGDAALLQPEPEMYRHFDAKQKGPSLLEEQGYIWIPHHFRQLDEEGRDTNRRNVFLPISLGATTEIRGFGQLFTPNVYYNWFRTITNDTTGVMFNSTYYEQFQNARDFTIDTIVAFFFKNPQSATQFAPVKFYVFGMPPGFNATTYFNGTQYKSMGFGSGRSQLPVVFEAEISPEGLDTTINGNLINPLIFVFDPPLAFANNSAAAAIFINDDGEALQQPIGGQSDVRDFQILGAFWERRSGNNSGFEPWKSQGLVMFRNPTNFADSIYSMFRALRYTNGDSAVFDNWMNFTGVVDINATVKYHFGRGADAQGLGNPTPNPVTADTRIPFSLTAVSDIAIDLYDVRGTHVRQLLRERYVPGNYSIALGAGDLANGTYVVRMVAGEKVYTMKVNVGR